MTPIDIIFVIDKFNSPLALFPEFHAGDYATCLAYSPRRGIMPAKVMGWQKTTPEACPHIVESIERAGISYRVICRPTQKHFIKRRQGIRLGNMTKYTDPRIAKLNAIFPAAIGSTPERKPT